MSDTKSEPASERTLARARARGDFPFTSDWTLAAVLLGSVTSSTYAVPLFVRAWSSWARSLFAGRDFGAALASELFWPVSVLMFVPYLSVFAVTLAQRGATWRLWATESDHSAEPQSSGGGSSLVRFMGHALKVAVLAWALVPELLRSVPGLLAAFDRDAHELLPLLLGIARTLCLRAALVLIALGVADLIVQQLMRLRRLRMTRRQALDERRESEGDPRWLGERRSRARPQPSDMPSPELAAAQLAQLEAATLVLTGAGRAVALRYRAGVDSAPSLWLKAEGQAALELVARAYALGLPLASDDVLTSDLCRLELMQSIPASLHAPVAVLLTAAAVPQPDAAS